MIPYFPEFKPLELSDKKNISKLTAGYAFHSDWNFISLWTWNSGKQCQVSQLHGNLVMQVSDYMTDKKLFTFLGDHRPIQTIKSLTQHAKSQGLPPVVKLMPEDMVTEHMKTHKDLKITLDRDNFDYVYSLKSLSELKGNRYRGKRNFVNRFVRNYSKNSSFKTMNLTTKVAWEEVSDLFVRWESSTKKSRTDTINEMNTLFKLVQYAKSLDGIIAFGLYYKKQLIGISINHMVDEHHTINHHEIADNSFVGAFQYLRQQVAVELGKSGSKYINYEQDLGIPGLRRTKMSWRPVKYLKMVRIKNTALL